MMEIIGAAKDICTLCKDLRSSWSTSRRSWRSPIRSFLLRLSRNLRVRPNLWEMIALVTRVQRKTTSRYKRQQLTKSVATVCDISDGGKTMQFFQKRHQRVIQRPMLHATMNLFNCFAVACYLRNFASWATFANKTCKRQPGRVHCSFAENGPSDQFRKRILFSMGGSRYNKWSDERSWKFLNTEGQSWHQREVSSTECFVGFCAQEGRSTLQAKLQRTHEVSKAFPDDVLLSSRAISSNECFFWVPETTLRKTPKPVKRTWTLVPCSKAVPDDAYRVLTQATTRHALSRGSDGLVPCENTQNVFDITLQVRQWKSRNTPKANPERKMWGLLERRLEDGSSTFVFRRLSPALSRRTCLHPYSTKSLW